MNTLRKNELRQKCHVLRDSFGEEFIETASRSACTNIEKSQAFIDADIILLYYPIKNEISPLPLLEVCLKTGKTVGFPVCQTKNSTLIFKKVTSINDFKCTPLGLFEPTDNCEVISCSENTVCIVPALAFSLTGHRLGYGKGFYDRFLSNFKGKSIGLSYSALVFDRISHEKHDVPIDMIITESEVLKIVGKN